MKIVHIVMSGPFTEQMTYQENILPEYHSRLGHQVLIIASCLIWGADGKIAHVSPERKHLRERLDLIRLPYNRLIGAVASEKIRKCKMLRPIVEEFSPDIIFLHDVQNYELLWLASYRRKHPEARLYVDSHSDLNNSARNFLSRYVLHGIIYRYWLKKAYDAIDRLYYVSISCRDFLKDEYLVSEEKLCFLPLGGVVPDSDYRADCRASILAHCGMGPESILFIHSGKLNRLKGSIDLLRTFSRFRSSRMHLLIAGIFDDECRAEAETLIASDNHIHSLGWKNSDELYSLLCGIDCFIQPISQTATTQNAICCGAAMAISNIPSHKIYIDGNGWLLDKIEDFAEIAKEINDDPGVLLRMSARSTAIGRSMLDYTRLAEITATV